MRYLLAKLGVHDISGFLALAKQFVKFGVVGISNTLLALAIYYVLVLVFGIHYILSNAIAFVISVLNAYYWNSKYVFKQARPNVKSQIARIFMVYGLSFIVGTAMMYIIVEVLGISEVFALVVYVIVIPMNFLLIKFWVFGKGGS